jgi:two-component system, sporulation sensor kinase E
MNSSKKTEPGLNLTLSRMDNPEKEIELLKKALDRQKKARQAAEKILEEKSKELYDAKHQLEEANQRLESLLEEKTSELQGVFITIVDPYVVFDLQGNIIRMNAAAKELCGCSPEDDAPNFLDMVHESDRQYTLEALDQLKKVGILKNYQARVNTLSGNEHYIQMNCSVIYDGSNQAVAVQGVIRDVTREREVSRILQEQKKQLDIIVENSPLGIALTVDGVIQKANRSFTDMIGYRPGEVTNLKFGDFSAAEDPKEATKLDKELQKGKRDSFTIVKRYTTKEEELVLGKTSISAVRDTAGKIEYEVVLVEDITSEREAREKLKASENRLSSLIRNLNTGVLLEDENRRISITNKKFCQLINLPVDPEQLIGLDCVKASEQSKILFKDPEGFIRRINNLLKKKVPALGDELQMTDGRILERDYIPIFEGKDYKGHLWTYTDVTLSRNYKRNLEQQKEKYSGIIANMNLGLIEVDTEDTIQLVNQSFCEMSGYSEAELLGKKASKMLRNKHAKLVEEKDGLREKGISDSYEIEILRKDNSERHWLVSGAPRYDETGQLVGSIGIHLDITDQKELEFQKAELFKALEHRNKELQEYAHIVSHDLKSPLRSISALSTWMLEDYSDKLDENGVMNLQHMQDKVERMDKLIDGILKYSSVQSSTDNRVAVDVNEVISDICEIIFIPEHVKVGTKSKLPTIQADPTKIHQLFQNIIGNAVNHIEREKGWVEVAYEDQGSHWMFSIADNGVGIPKEYHEKIFKIFQSVGNKERSTGIGLSIVKKIIDLYNGKIWLESAQDEGTTFYFTLEKQA